MERGIIRSYDKNSGIGMIARASDVDVKFMADSVVGRERMGLKQGDHVWFEVDNVQSLHMAINVRKCK